MATDDTIFKSASKQEAILIPAGKAYFQLKNIDAIKDLSFEAKKNFFSQNERYPTQEDIEKIPENKKQDRWLFIFKVFLMGEDGFLEDFGEEFKKSESPSMKIYKGTSSNSLKIISALMGEKNHTTLEDSEFRLGDVKGKMAEVNVLITKSGSGREYNKVDGWFPCDLDPPQD